MCIRDSSLGRHIYRGGPQLFSYFQIDVLEADVLCNVIILQTVLEEVKHRSSTIYKRLKDIINDKRRKFYVFVNEHHKLVFLWVNLLFYSS